MDNKKCCDGIISGSYLLGEGLDGFFQLNQRGGSSFELCPWPTFQNQKSRGEKSGLLARHGCLIRRLMTSPPPRTCSLASFWPWSWCALWHRLAGTSKSHIFQGSGVHLCLEQYLYSKFFTWVLHVEIKRQDFQWFSMVTGPLKIGGDIGLTSGNELKLSTWITLHQIIPNE